MPREPRPHFDIEIADRRRAEPGRAASAGQFDEPAEQVERFRWERRAGQLLVELFQSSRVFGARDQPFKMVPFRVALFVPAVEPERMLRGLDQPVAERFVKLSSAAKCSANCP